MSEHPSNLPLVIDRTKSDQQGVLFHGASPIVQSGELNELQTIARNRSNRISNLIAKDGDRVEGGEAIVDVDALTVQLTDGKIYIAGDVLDVAEATLAAVAMTGQVKIGVRLVKSWITHEDDVELIGQIPGALSEGEAGAAREIASITWAILDDGGTGDFFPVYQLQDGTILDHKAPPALDGVSQAIAIYDRAANGNYIVHGCRVTALGADAGNQVFSIEQGEANIHGVKITRHAALRIKEIEAWSVAAIPGETHSYGGGASDTFLTNRFPIDLISSILLTKEKTVTLTRGAVAHGQDGLPDGSLVEIISVVQSGTTYVVDTDYILTADTVNWSPAGAEPAAGSSYNVTYYYRDSIIPDSFTDKEITVSGGVAGEDIIVAYTWKLPRIDLICLNKFGVPIYVKGVSSASNLLPPAAPAQLLKLAEVHNDWLSTPKVENNGIYIRTAEEIDRMSRAQENLIRLIMIERQKSSIDAREPVAKRNMFVDPLIDDTYRDAGEVQTTAIGEGIMQLPITPSFFIAPLSAPVMLDHVEEVVASQELSTACVKINPYQNFTPMPAAMDIEPAVDYWTESATAWESPATNEFNRGVRSDNGPLEEVTESVRSLGNRTEQVEFLRQIPLTAKIKGFGAGENLQSLTFDDVNVKPGGVQTADASGDLDIAFTIPANVPAGSKDIIAEGEGGSFARAVFTGQGTIQISVMQRVSNISRWSRPPAPPEDPDAGGATPPDPGAPVAAGLFLFGLLLFLIDPQAQTFRLRRTRQLIGVDFKLCNKGDAAKNILVHQVKVENGTPTADIVAEGFVPMADKAVGWISSRYNSPILTVAGDEQAFVVKTDDGDHAISVANLGDYDTDNQSYVTSHPYSTGVRLSSSNASTWQSHQGSSLAFRLIAAKYTSTTKTVDLGTHDLVNASDLQVRASVEIPSAECSVVFEIERTNGDIFQLLPEQVLQLDEFLTETVELRAVLSGTTELSPILHAPVMLIAGELASTGTYITRAFDAGTAVRLTSYFKTFLPAGASVDIEYDLVDDSWITLPLISTDVLAFPNWTERKHEVDPITGSLVRLKITLNGTPGARPRLGDLGAAIF